jgi:DNA mismatch endonuclease (patch repair protein)
MPKLARNRRRDQLVTKRLTQDGWQVVRLWEHIPPPEAAEQVALTVQAAFGK